MALADYQTLVMDLVRDDAAKITNAQRDNAITLAASRYSGDRPRTKVEDAAATGGNLLDLPAGWQADFSKLNSLETPIGDVPPSLISSERRRLYEAPTGTKIQLDDALAAGAQVRHNYTIRHQLDGAGDTIPVDDHEVVASYAASILLDQLASFYSGETDSTIQADGVDHKSRAAEYAARARALRKRYFDQLGIDDKRTAAAGVMVALEPRDSLGGPRLTHRLRR